MVILDTKPFVLLLIGLLDRNYVQIFMGTKEFSLENFDELNFNLQNTTILTTPYILSEVSHLTLESNMRYDLKQRLSPFLCSFHDSEALTEVFPTISQVFSNNHILKIGANDCSLLEIPEAKKYPIITSDGVFADHARSLGQTVIKFLPEEGFVSH